MIQTLSMLSLSHSNPLPQFLLLNLFTPSLNSSPSTFPNPLSQPSISPPPITYPTLSITSSSFYSSTFPPVHVFFEPEHSPVGSHHYL